jgi:glutamate transport system substrate-binding protein
MKLTKLVPSLCVVILMLGLSACSAPKAAITFPAETTMEKLNRAGKITIGVKSDQPGLGFRNPITGKYEGFDIEIAQLVAAELGLDPDQIEYVETLSKDREQVLKDGSVDIVVASYSITPERRQDVGQAGPYFVTGQRLLVREEEKHKITGPDRVDGGRVCSATGSTSIITWQKKFGGYPISSATYTDCVQKLLSKKVDAVTTDGAVLLGYAAQQPDQLEVVGRPFSEEHYGIGYRKPDLEFCKFLTDTIKKAQENGDWDKAFDATLGKAGVETPRKPPVEPCQDKNQQE